MSKLYEVLYECYASEIEKKCARLWEKYIVDSLIANGSFILNKVGYWSQIP